MELKTVEDVKLYVKVTLPRIAVLFETTYGMPFEVFNDYVKSMNLLDLLVMCKNYEKKY